MEASMNRNVRLVMVVAACCLATAVTFALQSPEADALRATDPPPNGVFIDTLDLAPADPAARLRTGWRDVCAHGADELGSRHGDRSQRQSRALRIHGRHRLGRRRG